MVSKLWLSVLLLCVGFAEITEEDDVWVLDEGNFQEALDSQPDILVEFYAPWCGHCKKLAPEYAKAAKRLKENDPPIRIAKVDATVNSNLANKYEVRGYPTIKYFINKNPTDYSGGRTEDSIVSWVLKRAGPAFTIIDSLADLQKKIENEKVVAVLFADKDAAEASVFEYSAKNIEGANFYQVTDQSIADEYKVTKPKVIVFKAFDDGRSDYEGSFNTYDLTKFVDKNTRPWVMPFDDSAIEFIFQKQNPGFFFLRSEADKDNFEKSIQEIAKDLQNDLAFTFADLSVEVNKRLADFMGVTPEQQPTAIILDPQAGFQKFKLEAEATAESLRQFAMDWKQKVLSPFLKSEEIPANDYEKDVRVLVGKNFKEVVYDSTKDVLVEFYAPWCGHCKKLAPEYEKLGGMVKDIDSVIVAKIDSTANEVEGINIRGFPTIKFFPAKDKTPKEYEGERTAEALFDFIKTNANMPIEVRSDL